jgi:hypothetical protein
LVQGSATVPKRRRSRRWLRAVIPFVVVAVGWLFTGAMHAIEEPNLDDPGTMSPTGTGPHGSSRLAAMLTANGVTVEHVTSGRNALQFAAASDATVFIPAPNYLRPEFYADLAVVAGQHRVVLVQPGLLTAVFSGLPIFPTGDRWATAVVEPRCGTAYANRAGRAAAHNSSYTVDDSFDAGFSTTVDCYDGGLVGVRQGDTESIYVGATDPFRNDRIDEVGNAALATALLSEYRRLIWVDVHASEPIARPSLPALSLPEYRRDDQDRTSTGLPFLDAFPSWLWATLLLAAGATILLAIARARRLGPPVAEPLPVLVPAAEAVTGRGRLYERIGAREASLQALRGAAIGRLARSLNPFGGAVAERDLLVPGAAAEALVQRIVARTGAPEHTVRVILYGPPPTDDAGLAAAVADLDRLVAAASTSVPATSVAQTPAAQTSVVQPQGGTP